MHHTLFRPVFATSLLALLLAGCSGPHEDPRVTFCKGLVQAQHPEAASIDWTGNDNTFRRPEYATATLRFDVADPAGRRSAGEAACYFAYEASEDTAQHLADPFSAYATLPFAMTLDGRMLADAELAALRKGEQLRQGQAVIATLEREAAEMAAQLRASLGQ